MQLRRIPPLATLLVAAAIVFLGLAEPGQGKKPRVISKENNNIGVVDYTKLQEKLSALIRIRDLEASIDAELKDFNAQQRRLISDYLAQLEKDKEEEMQGRTEQQKREITRKYDILAQEKALGIKTAVDAKAKELQDRLAAEKERADQSVRALIASVAKKERLELVFDKNSVYEGGVDITDKVIQQDKKQKATPTPTPTPSQNAPKGGT